MSRQKCVSLRKGTATHFPPLPAARIPAYTEMTGYITGEPLNQVYSHARMFVLPSYHEGLPIVLLEAMSYGLPVMVSDIPANKEVGLPDDRYFRCGDVADLKEKLSLLLEKDWSIDERNKMREQIEEKYNWDKIANQTIEVYRKVLRRMS
ncbi:MAG: glycosyltransferase [Deltaproteobacteria bacterium]|nr:glycosyltransferase [Deltaproteobacteria bacterium]